MTSLFRTPQSPLDLRPRGKHTTPAGFLDRMREDKPTKESRYRCRARGICEECGRALTCTSFDAAAAVWSCLCGYSLTAVPRTSLYKRARELREEPIR